MNDKRWRALTNNERQEMVDAAWRMFRAGRENYGAWLAVAEILESIDVRPTLTRDSPTDR